MARKTLSKSVQRIYDYITAYVAEHGYPPTVREIGQAVHLRSPSTVHMHLRTLENLGYLKRDPNKPRALEICEPRDESALVGDPQDKLELFSVREDPNAGLTTLPVVGRVAAGQPVLAEQNIEEVVQLPLGLIEGGSSFLLRVHGESMINAGILDNDLIVVKETQEAQNGQIVVALVGDEATVKTYFKEHDRVRLQPQNDTMEPIYATNPHILGRVTGLIRTAI